MVGKIIRRTLSHIIRALSTSSKETKMAQKMFVAGASGVIGLPLCKMLLAADAFDAEGLLKIVGDIRPDVVFHELTDPPDGLAAD